MTKAFKKVPWSEQADLLEERLLEAIRQYRPEAEVQALFDKWRFKVISPPIDFENAKDLFDSDAEAEQSLSDLSKKYQAFLEEYKKLKLTAHAELSEAAKHFFVESLSDDLDAIEGVINSALKITQDKRSKRKKAGISDAHKKNWSIDSSIRVLFEAYKDITGKEIKFSYNDLKRKPSGPLFRFCSPFMRALYPGIKDNTLLDRMKHVREQSRKTKEIE